MKQAESNPDVLSCSPPRAGSFHSHKVPSSQPFAHPSGSMMQLSPQKQSLLSPLQKPKASLPPKTNGIHSPGPKIPKSSNNLSPSSAQPPDISSPPGENQKKKKKKKKKRRHSEVEADEPPAAAPAVETPADLADSASEKKRKKKKKRKSESVTDGERERECVPSHLDTSGQDEDWCQAGMWSLTAPPDEGAEKQQKPGFAAAASTQGESEQDGRGRDPLKLLKKKKKKKKLQLEEEEAADLQDTTSAGCESETWVEFNHIDLFYNNLSITSSIDWKRAPFLCPQISDIQFSVTGLENIDLIS